MSAPTRSVSERGWSPARCRQLEPTRWRLRGSALSASSEPSRRSHVVRCRQGTQVRTWSLADCHEPPRHRRPSSRSRNSYPIAGGFLDETAVRGLSARTVQDEAGVCRLHQSAVTRGPSTRPVHRNRYSGAGGQRRGSRRTTIKKARSTSGRARRQRCSQRARACVTSLKDRARRSCLVGGAAHGRTSRCSCPSA